MDEAAREGRLGRVAQISLRNLRRLDCVARPNSSAPRLSCRVSRKSARPNLRLIRLPACTQRLQVGQTNPTGTNPAIPTTRGVAEAGSDFRQAQRRERSGGSPPLEHRLALLDEGALRLARVLGV